GAGDDATAVGGHAAADDDVLHLRWRHRGKQYGREHGAYESAHDVPEKRFLPLTGDAAAALAGPFLAAFDRLTLIGSDERKAFVDHDAISAVLLKLCQIAILLFLRQYAEHLGEHVVLEVGHV